MNKLFIGIFILIFSVNGFAQKKIKSDSTIFKIQVDYLSDYIYNGRADSIQYPYQMTTASVQLANGLYGDFSANYLLTPGDKRFDFFQLDLGYEFNLSNKLTGSIYASKYFYSSESALLNGNIKTDIGGTLVYDFGAFQFSNTLDVFFASKADVQLLSGVEKSIFFPNKQATWNIIPSLYATLSTINYYESELVRRVNPRNTTNRPPGGGTVSVLTKTNQTGFKFLAVEASLPIYYERGKFGLYVLPTYAIPFNQITSTTTITNTLNNKVVNTFNSTAYSELNLTGKWYFQTGVFFKF